MRNFNYWGPRVFIEY